MGSSRSRGGGGAMYGRGVHGRRKYFTKRTKRFRIIKLLLNLKCRLLEKCRVLETCVKTNSVEGGLLDRI
jgi:hypothetical protein